MILLYIIYPIFTSLLRHNETSYSFYKPSESHLRPRTFFKDSTKIDYDQVLNKIRGIMKHSEQTIDIKESINFRVNEENVYQLFQTSIFEQNPYYDLYYNILTGRPRSMTDPKILLSYLNEIFLTTLLPQLHGNCSEEYALIETQGEMTELIDNQSIREVKEEYSGGDDDMSGEQQKEDSIFNLSSVTLESRQEFATSSLNFIDKIDTKFIISSKCLEQSALILQLWVYIFYDGNYFFNSIMENTMGIITEYEQTRTTDRRNSDMSIRSSFMTEVKNEVFDKFRHIRGIIFGLYEIICKRLKSSRFRENSKLYGASDFNKSKQWKFGQFINPKSSIKSSFRSTVETMTFKQTIDPLLIQSILNRIDIVLSIGFWDEDYSFTLKRNLLINSIFDYIEYRKFPVRLYKGVKIPKFTANIENARVMEPRLIVNSMHNLIGKDSRLYFHKNTNIYVSKDWEKYTGIIYQNLKKYALKNNVEEKVGGMSPLNSFSIFSKIKTEKILNIYFKIICKIFNTYYHSRIYHLSLLFNSLLKDRLEQDDNSLIILENFELIRNSENLSFFIKNFDNPKIKLSQALNEFLLIFPDISIFCVLWEYLYEYRYVIEPREKRDYERENEIHRDKDDQYIKDILLGEEVLEKDEKILDKDEKIAKKDVKDMTDIYADYRSAFWKLSFIFWHIYYSGEDWLPRSIRSRIKDFNDGVIEIQKTCIIVNMSLSNLPRFRRDYEYQDSSEWELYSLVLRRLWQDKAEFG